MQPRRSPPKFVTRDVDLHKHSAGIASFSAQAPKAVVQEFDGVLDMNAETAPRDRTKIFNFSSWGPNCIFRFDT